MHAVGRIRRFVRQRSLQLCLLSFLFMAGFTGHVVNAAPAGDCRHREAVTVSDRFPAPRGKMGPAGRRVRPRTAGHQKGRKPDGCLLQPPADQGLPCGSGPQGRQDHPVCRAARRQLPRLNVHPAIRPGIGPAQGHLLPGSAEADLRHRVREVSIDGRLQQHELQLLRAQPELEILSKTVRSAPGCGGVS